MSKCQGLGVGAPEACRSFFTWWFRVLGVRFRVSDCGFWAASFGYWVSDFGFRVAASRFWFSGFRCKVSCMVFRVLLFSGFGASTNLKKVVTSDASHTDVRRPDGDMSFSPPLSSSEHSGTFSSILESSVEIGGGRRGEPGESARGGCVTL